MKRRTDILTHLLLLLLVLVACTADDAIKENLSHQDEYVTVRMHIPGMKAVATRAAETDNITSIVALVFRNDQLQSVTEYSTTNSALHPISPISGTITIEKPANGDVIHFLANLPADYSNEKKYIAYLNEQIGKSQTDVLCNLSSRDYDKLSYWGMATRNENNAVMDVILYRNKAMIEIKPGENCTFRQDELFIAGLDNPNNVGLLVPYNGGFNFDLDNNDYLTLPQDPDPLDKTDELTNYGAGYDNAYYVFEHANPNNENGLYVICKIGDDYYKVALHDEKGQPYPIIRNHKYTILVNDLDAGCETYSEALSADPIRPTVIETKDVTFSYTDNAMLNLNNNDTYTVTMNVPNGGILTALNIAAEGFTVISSGGSLSGPTNNEYSYTGGTTQFTFTPTSAGNRTIRIYNGQGENISVPEKNISVTVNAAIAATANPSTIYYDGNDKNVTVNVTIPKGVSGLNISAPDFNYGDDTDGSYTYNRGDATTETTVQLEFTLKDNVKEVKTSTFTFSDASGNANVSSAEVDINVAAIPAQGTEVVIYGVEHDVSETGIIAENDEVAYLLLDLANNQEQAGKAEEYRSYFKSGATIKIEFTCNVTESWHGENLRMEIGTTWSSSKFARYEYKAEDNNQPLSLSHTFTSEDMGTTDNTDTVHGAGLRLMLRFVTITKISIIPAP